MVEFGRIVTRKLQQYVACATSYKRVTNNYKIVTNVARATSFNRTYHTKTLGIKSDSIPTRILGIWSMPYPSKTVGIKSAPKALYQTKAKIPLFAQKRYYH